MLDENLKDLSISLDSEIQKISRSGLASVKKQKPLVKDSGSIFFTAITSAVRILETPVYLNTRRKLEACSSIALQLEQSILSIFNKIKSRKHQGFSFYDLYIPESANKLDAEKLIRDAIEILNRDNTLTREARNKIIDHLEKALKSLKEGSTANFFGAIQEVLIVLGAVGSLAGGYVAVTQHVQTKFSRSQNREKNIKKYFIQAHK